MKAKYLCNKPTNGDFFILIDQPPDRRSKIDVTILQLSLWQNIPDFAWLLQSHSWILKVPKSEIFDSSDCHDFYTIVSSGGRLWELK